jgi:uncharacterized protein
MLVYKATASRFITDMDEQTVVGQLREGFKRQGISGPSPNEARAWQNSLQFMLSVVNHPDVPRDCGVAIEYRIPIVGKRVDFILTGFHGKEDPAREPGHAAIIVELKQWETLEAASNLNEVVRVSTWVGGRLGEHPHPSYQAWSYAQLLEKYNSGVASNSIALHPCAFLHNYQKAANDPLLDPRYEHCLQSAPAFCHGEIPKLRTFITSNLDMGDGGRVLDEIEAGKIQPSKSLQDALSEMVAGSTEFVMVDDQKVVFEKALRLGLDAQASGRKHVLIVRGGPGTGKSVVAVNLLVHLTKGGMLCQYVSKNSAPRNVYASRLIANNARRSYINALFCGSGNFIDCKANAYGALVVDEAHRLNEKSGLYGNLGENQTMELIRAARFTVFFIDEAQRVTFKDAGSAKEIRYWAERSQAEVTELQLTSQFRCNGSEGYLDWVDDVLGVPRPGAEEDTPVSFDYDFRVFDDPNELAMAIQAMNAESNRSRLLAGYCWNWAGTGRNDPGHPDINLPEWGFSRSWNLASTATWAIDPGSVDQVGCVHTSQGLEFEYVGVIIGEDLRFQDGRTITDPSRRARTDQSLSGLKKLAKDAPEEAARIGDEIIRNTYRVLLSRGQRGCFVFCVDQALGQYLKDCLARRGPLVIPSGASDEAGLPDLMGAGTSLGLE